MNRSQKSALKVALQLIQESINNFNSTIEKQIPYAEQGYDSAIKRVNSNKNKIIKLEKAKHVIEEMLKE